MNNRIELSGMPVLKGPFNDYLYVIREDFFEGGASIVQEGNHGKWIWTVGEGVVRVTRETPKGPLVLARIGEGCFIGTIKALLFGDYERNASLIAEGDLRLCLLDIDPFYSEYSKLSPGFRQLLLCLDQRLRKLNMRAIDIYSGDMNEEKKLLKEIAHNRVFEPGDGLYRIVEGSVTVVVTDFKRHRLLFSLENNNFIGKIPFVEIDHGPESVILVPSRDLKTEKIDIIEIQKEYNALSKTFKNLICNICNYIQNTTDLISRLHVKK